MLLLLASSCPARGLASEPSAAENVTVARREYLPRKPQNLTVGYMTAIKGELKDRQGLAISGAFTMALDEVRTVLFFNIFAINNTNEVKETTRWIVWNFLIFEKFFIGWFDIAVNEDKDIYTKPKRNIEKK